MIKKRLFISSIILFMLIALITISAGCGSQSGAGSAEPTATAVGDDYIKIELKERPFTLELALNDRQRAKGLMKRDEIAEDGGMLFVMPPVEPFPAELTFWMKDCLVPIDVIFLTAEGMITAIHEMEPPAPGTPDNDLIRYSSNEPAQFAVELRGGMASELGLEQGEVIELPFEQLLEMAE